MHGGRGSAFARRSDTRESPLAHSGHQRSGLPPPASRPCRVGIDLNPKTRHAMHRGHGALRGLPATRWQARTAPHRHPVRAPSRSQQVPEGWEHAMKCSRSHKCCDRCQMSWQRPVVYTRQRSTWQTGTRARADVHVRTLKRSYGGMS